MLVTLNINETVRVKLTEHARGIVSAGGTEVYFTMLDDGMTECQLWVLMMVFGEYMANGAEQCFDRNIIEIGRVGGL
jgi:hypothetical protein